MAVIHQAELRPSKAEALATWLPTQQWSGVTDGDEITIAGKFRFDDPAGEVGVETILVRTADGRVLHAPLTYRGAPLEGADDFLVTEMDHSVLGRRWVYDAAGDPVYADVLRRAIATGGHEAELTRTGAPGTWEKEGTATGSGTAPDSPTVSSVIVHGADDTTTIDPGHGSLVIARIVGADLPSGETLTGSWSGGSGVLAVLRS